jgi:PAS domain S-box-containing protein
MPAPKEILSNMASSRRSRDEEEAPTAAAKERGGSAAMEVAHREALDTIQQQARLFEAVTSTTPDFVYIFDPQGRFVYANRRLLEVWGMRLPEIIGKTCRELGYEQWHHDMHMREIAEVIKTRKSIKGEVPFRAERTGIFGVYEYIFSPVIDSDGEVELIAGTTRDITDRKQAEEALREGRERYRELFVSMSEGFCVLEKTETDGKVDFMHLETNPAAAVSLRLAKFRGGHCVN